MYINKIDELLDRIIEDYFNTIVLKSKEFDKILSEINFVKYQLEINKILSDFSKALQQYV